MPTAKKLTVFKSSTLGDLATRRGRRGQEPEQPGQTKNNPVAIYHFHAKVVHRAKGQSAVAGAAYRSGSKLYEASTGMGLHPRGGRLGEAKKRRRAQQRPRRQTTSCGGTLGFTPEKLNYARAGRPSDSSTSA